MEAKNEEGLVLETKAGQKLIPEFYSQEGEGPPIPMFVGFSGVRRELSGNDYNRGVLGRFDSSTIGKARQSMEPTEDMSEYYSEGSVLQPPVPMAYYTELARRDPIHWACIRVKVANIVGQGYRIRPVAEMKSIMETVSVAEASMKDPDPKQRSKIESFLDSQMPTMSFTDVLSIFVTDWEGTGMGYFEFLRDGGSNLSGVLPLRSEGTRLLKDNRGYMLARPGSSEKRFFVRYTGDPAARMVTMRKQAINPGDRRRKSPGDILKIEEYGVTAPSYSSVLPADYSLSGLASGELVTVQLNEALHFSKISSKDSPYGDPDILSAGEDFLSAQNARQFNLSYFDNSTVPRLAIIVKGGYLADKVVDEIRNFVASQERIDVMNQVMLLQTGDPTGLTDIVLEPLSVAQLRDAGFQELRAASDLAVMRAHLTPVSMFESVQSSNSVEANFRFLANVVRPAQRRIETTFNYIFQKEFKVTDWVLDLNIPDLLTERQRAEINDILLRRGVLSVNDVRRSIGAAPVVGGDEPFVSSPGQGLIPISFMEIVTKKGAGAVSALSDLISPVAGNMQTPPKNAKVYAPSEKDIEAGKAFVLSADAVKNLPQDEKELMCALTEAMGAEPAVLKTIFPSLYPEIPK